MVNLGQPARGQNSEKCTGCKKPIHAEYLLVKGKAWHPDCFTCEECKKPLVNGHRGGVNAHGRRSQSGAYIEHDGAYYHSQCYAEAFNKTCDVCASPLVGRYFSDGRGYQFCAHHTKQLPRCFSCQRLICQSITGGGVRLSDGRALCHICKPSAIVDAKSAQQAFAEAKHFLKQVNFDLSGYDIPLALTDQRAMRGRLNRAERGLDARRAACGQTRTVIQKQGKRVVKREVTGIAILHHLSYIHFTSIAVHELCHAWLFYNEVGPLPLRVEEGLCVFMEYRFLKYMVDRKSVPGSTLHEEGSFLMRMIEENQDLIYGWGFQAAMAAVKKHGFAATLKSLRERKYWPGTTPFRDDLKIIWRKFFS